MKLLPHAAFFCILVKVACICLVAQSLSTEKFTAIPRVLPTEVSCVTLQQQDGHLISQRKYSAAAVTLQNALSSCPDRAQILLELANVQMLSEQFTAALSTLHRLLVNDPENLEARITQGEIFYLLDKDSDAVSSFISAINVDPESAEPHYLLGRVYYEDSHLKEAIQQFHEALKLNPDAYRAYDGLALCYESMGDIHLTIQNFMNGLKLVYKAHPHYDVIYADFAEFLIRYGVNQKAFNLASEAASRNPREPRDFFLAGKALEQEGKFFESVRWLKRAAEMDPSYPDPHYFLARIYRKLGENERAEEENRICERLFQAAPKIKR